MIVAIGRKIVRTDKKKSTQHWIVNTVVRTLSHIEASWVVGDGGCGGNGEELATPIFLIPYLSHLPTKHYWT